jgi:hypothetical protein
MDDIKKAIDAAFQNMVEGEVIEKMIYERLENTIGSIIDDSMKSYSDFGRALSKQIQQQMCIDVESISLQEHTHAMVKMIESIIAKHVQSEAGDKIKKEVAELFGGCPAEITMSELLKKYKEEAIQDKDADDYECALFIEESQHGWFDIALNPSQRKSYPRREDIDRRDCELRLHLNPVDGDVTRLQLSWLQSNRHPGVRSTDWMLTGLYGTARLLFKMYCAGAILKMDQGVLSEEYDLSYEEVDE